MTRFAAPLIAAFAVFAALTGTAASVRAAATFENLSIDNSQYPKQLTFKVTLSAPADITDVTLSYEIVGRGTRALGKPADAITPAKNMTVIVTIQTNTGVGYVPVGSDFVYHWEATTADGATASSADVKYLYLPPGKEWKSVSNDIMAVWYHGDRESTAKTYLQAGIETYDRIGKLTGATLKFVPVKVILFAEEKELETARAGGATSADSLVTNCGTKVANDVVHVIPVTCGSPDRTDTLRHEFTHILNEAAGFGTLSRIPPWMDEGTAMYGQSTPGNAFSVAQTAARANRLLPFTNLQLAQSTASTVDLFYGQAYMMVKFLVDRGGPAKYAELFAIMKKGSRFEDAIKTVYGFDMTGFESEFRAAAGSAPAATVQPTARSQAQPTTAPTTRAANAQPTARPTTAPAQSTNDDEDGPDLFAIGIFGAAVLFALLAVMAFLVSMVLQNNRTRAAAAGQPPEPRSDNWRPPEDPR